MAAKYYSYCPRCGRQNSANRLPEGAIPGVEEIHQLFYEICPKCGETSAAWMKYDVADFKGLKHSKQCKQFRNKIKELYDGNNVIS